MYHWRVATQVNILEAKNQLSRLVKAVVAGEDVVIASNGVPMVRLVPVKARRKQRKPGAWSKLPAAAPDWDAPELNRRIADELAGKRSR
jgi:prevent-host-death family protein